MRRRFEVSLSDAVLIACTLVLLGLVYAEGWTWPLKVAACIIPVSLLIG
jgi:hypothetical protein